jgi:septal ring factor EnvC (AmiA/AmiB activator)
MDMDEPVEKEFPKGPVIVAVVLIGMIAFAFWAVQDKKHQQEREAVLQAMDKELATDEQAVKDERRKLEEMSKSVEDLRTRIQYDQVKDKKAAIDEFNKRAADQRAEREKFVQMADQYNQKLAKFKELEK